MGRPKATKPVYPKVLPKLAPAPATSSSRGSAAGPPLKKAKTVWSKTRGRKGAMEVFNSLPLDLLYEILTYLGPAELYALNLTSKTFRNIVAGPNSTGLWVRARLNVGLPELTLKTMTDVQYAHLMFGKGCRFCKRTNAGKPEPVYRVRVCNTCLKEHFVNDVTGAGAAAIQAATGNQLHPLTRHVSKLTFNDRGGPYHYLPELKRVNAQLQELDPSPDDYWRDADFVNRRSYRWRAAVNPEDPPPEPETPFQHWYATQVDDLNKNAEDAEKIRAWSKNREQSKANDKNVVRKARKAEIERLFKEQGFQVAELGRWEFVQDPLVRKPEPVTERNWSKIESDLKPKLLDIRRRMRATGFQAKYWQFKRDSSDGSGFPPARIAEQLPVIKAALDDVSTFVEPDTLFSDNLAALEAGLQTLVRARREGMIRAIAKAYGELRDAIQREKNGERVNPFVQGLAFSSITLPRLPPWIPRRDSDPIIATDEQLKIFLETSHLANFECSKCNRLFDGSTIYGHIDASYGCFMIGYGCERSLEEWTRLATPADDTFTINRDTLLLTLHLHQLVANTPLSVGRVNENYEREAKVLDVQMPPTEKFSVSMHCKCVDPLATLSLYSPNYTFGTVNDAYSHVRRLHSLLPDRPQMNLCTIVSYSTKFAGELQKQLTANLAAERALPGSSDVASRLNWMIAGELGLGLGVDDEDMDADPFGAGPFDDGYGSDGAGLFDDGCGSDDYDSEDGRDDCVVM